MAKLGTVAIIGVGLIGGSVGRTLRERRLARRVVGIGRDSRRLDEAVAAGVLDTATTRLAEGVAEADVVVACTPVTRIVADLLEASAHAPASVLLTDAGSTKAQIVAGVEASPTARRQFVAAHPIAGSERKGSQHSRADLFDGRVCVLTPTPETPGDRLERACQFWQLLGCRIVELSPEAHDAALAATSHLPHAVAAALAGAVPPEMLPLAAGAYRDGTRVAGSDAALWTGIFLANREHLLEALTCYASHLETFRLALTQRDATALEQWWDLARNNRLVYDKLQNPDEPA